MSRLRGVRAVGLVLALTMLAGCASYPADPYGTLERATGGVLQVGVVHNEPFVSVVGGEPSGQEVDLVERYAEGIDARVEWTAGSEGSLVDKLDHGQVDMVIGGLTSDTQWKKKVGLTRSYRQTTDEFGKKRRHVMAVRQGENALLLDLDRFLQAEGGQ